MKNTTIMTLVICFHLLFAQDITNKLGAAGKYAITNSNDSTLFELDDEGSLFVEKSISIGHELDNNSDKIFFNGGNEVIQWVDLAYGYFQITHDLLVSGDFLEIPNGDLLVGSSDGGATDTDNIYFDSGEYLRWDEGASKFILSDVLQVTGDIEVTGDLEVTKDLFAEDLHVGTGDGTNNDFIYFDNSTDEYLRWYESETMFEFSDDIAVGTDDGGNDDYIYFDGGNEYLRWDNSQTEFDFSDDVDIAGELEADELWAKLGTSTFYKLTTTYGFSQEVYWTTSDNRMKTNIKPISSPLEKLKLLNGVTYDWNKKAKDYFTKDIKENVRPDESLSESEKEAIWEEERQKVLDEAERRKMSFIAQDVEKHFPEWVKENEDGIKEIDMKGLDGLLVEAIKELADKVNEQGKRIAELENQLSN